MLPDGAWRRKGSTHYFHFLNNKNVIIYKTKTDY